jgi:tetratricopeptide (TPR) repeat protein
MGFPLEEARAALAATSTGEDVQAAIEILVASRGATPAVQPRDEEDEFDRERRAAQRYEEEERDREAARKARHAARRKGPSREAVRPRPEEYGGPAGDDLARQAEQFMAQASEVGANVRTKAWNLWSQGKERAMKVYEEQKKAYEASHGQPSGERGKAPDGRPRWMVEAEEAERGGLPPSHEFGESSLGFKDSDDEGDRPQHRPQAQAKRPEPRPDPRRQRSDAPPPPSNADRIANLLGGGEPKSYISPHRHAKSRATLSPAPRAPTPARTPARPASPLKERSVVAAPGNALSTAAQHKTVGNDHFKLGRFAEAEGAYSRAISALPAGHLHLVPLHNNRAATWLKLGEPARAAADCGVVIDLVGAGYHPAKEAPLPATPDAEGVKLGDALVKATAKRAQAHEMAEKWKLALDDWERVLGFDGALGGGALKAQASDGVRRSKGMLSGGPAEPGARATPKATPRATPKPRPVDVGKSAAVSELRAAAAAAEAEDEQRAALKDGVDAKLAAWRTGKETNIRALLASLDLVLWPEVVLKVGMHELVTDKQVKIKYMKVIARLHPDKLAGASVEQRMMANGVFGTLSEA